MPPLRLLAWGPSAKKARPMTDLGTALTAGMNKFESVPKLSDTGWTLLSAESRHLATPEKFQIPGKLQRINLRVGEAARLLFDIETSHDGEVVDRGVDRMWVIVGKVIENGYLGILDSDPGLAENLKLFRGDILFFGSEHICNIDYPPKDYIEDIYSSIIASL